MNEEQMNNTFCDEMIKKITQAADEYGLDENWGFYNKNTGETVPIPLLSVIKLPKTHKRDKQGNICEKFNSKELFVKMYINATRELAKILTYKEYTIFSQICTYMHMWDCLILNSDMSPMSVKELSILLNVDYSEMKKLVKKYKDEELLVIDKLYSDARRYIIINPYLFMNGEYIVCDIKNKFAKTKWSQI